MNREFNVTKVVPMDLADALRMEVKAKRDQFIKWTTDLEISLGLLDGEVSDKQLLTTYQYLEKVALSEFLSNDMLDALDCFRSDQTGEISIRNRRGSRWT